MPSFSTFFVDALRDDNASAQQLTETLQCPQTETLQCNVRLTQTRNIIAFQFNKVMTTSARGNATLHLATRLTSGYSKSAAAFMEKR